MRVGENRRKTVEAKISNISSIYVSELKRKEIWDTWIKTVSLKKEDFTAKPTAHKPDPAHWAILSVPKDSSQL